MTTARSWSHLLALFTTLLIAQPARAGWFAQGNPICRAPGVQADISVLADGTGGSYVVWRDERRGPGISDLYAARVDPDGALHAGWPTDGLALAQSGAVGRSIPVVTASGQLMVAWIDVSTFRIQLQFVGSDGVRAASYPANGLTLPLFAGGPGGVSDILLRVVSDGAEGAYLLTNRFDVAELSSPLYLTRVGSDGAMAPGWTSDGVLVSDSFFLLGFRTVGLSPDGAGGVWVSQASLIDGGIGANLQVGSMVHVLPDRSLSAASLSPSGYPDPLGHFTSYIESALDAPDGAGGAFALWRVGGPQGPLYYLQRHLAGGGTGGPAVSAPVELQMLSDGAGGVYMLGVPRSAVQLELHRRDASLAAPAGWGSGVVLSTATDHQAIKSVRSGSNVYVGWSNGTAGSEDLRASAVTAAGSLASGWANEGTLVSSAAGVQILQGMAAGIAGDAYAAWIDTRSGNGDVYLAHLGPNGPIQDAVLEADLTVTPRDAEHLAHGHWVKAWIEPHAPQSASQIDAASLRMNGTVAIASDVRPRITDHDRDGIPELMVRFDRAAAAATLPAGAPAILTVTGTVGGQPFVAADTLLGDEHVVVSPEVGVRLNPGTVTRLAWQMPEGMHTARVALLASLNGGRSWDTIAADVPAGEPYDWQTPTRPSDHVLLAVTMTGEGEGPETLIDGLLGMSPELQIGNTLGVGDRGIVALAVMRNTPNPQSTRRVRVEFALATDDVATIELLDVTGRVRAREDVVGLAAGAHSLDLAAHGALPPGLYFVRLSQGGQRAQARITLID